MQKQPPDIGGSQMQSRMTRMKKALSMAKIEAETAVIICRRRRRTPPPYAAAARRTPSPPW